MATRRTKRSDGRYVVTLTHDGKRYSFYGRTQQEANAKLTEARERIKTSAPVRDATRTLADWLNEWIDTTLKVSNRAESTKTRHAGDIRIWIIPAIGTVSLARLQTSDIARLMLMMKEAGRADATRRNCYDVLSVALDDAVDSGLLATNPANRAGRTTGRKQLRPKRRKTEARYLSTSESGDLLRAADGLRYANVLRLILLTGLRRGEALALRWDGVDLEKGTAKVHGSLVRQNGELIVSHTKTEGSNRTVSLSEGAVALLRKQKASQAAERLESDSWVEGGFVFTTAFGGAVEPQNLLRTVRSAAAKAGLEGVHVHTLRHSYASAALMAGVPLKVVSVNMGHSSTQLTSDVYGHVPDLAARAGAEAVSAAFDF